MRLSAMEGVMELVLLLLLMRFVSSGDKRLHKGTVLSATISFGFDFQVPWFPCVKVCHFESVCRWWLHVLDRVPLVKYMGVKIDA